MGALSLILTLAFATLGGVGAQRLGIPGGLIFGSLLGAALVGLLRNVEVQIPASITGAAQVAIGAAIGVQLTRSNIAEVGWLILPALLSAVLIIAAGLGITYLLRLMHIAPDGDVLATSPGALNVLSSLALEQGVGAVQVAFFHLVRIVLVIASLPLVTRLLRGG
jgi:uncharacterized protein